MLRATAFLIVTALLTTTGRGGEIPTLGLYERGVVRVLNAKALADIRSLALVLLETSNFNSEQHRDLLKATPRSTHAAYRTAVAGRYLLASFETPRRIKTIGGEVDVLEIVIGLNRPDYVDSLFSIDSAGRVIAHQKYSGTDAIELLRRVKAAQSDGLKRAIRPSSSP
jgi:hypothetical protein